jgi:two-component system sensor histidine kinase DesK
MDEPWALRLAMGWLSVLPAVAPAYAVAVAAGHGTALVPATATILALAVGAVHGVFWLAPLRPAMRIAVAVAMVPLTLAAVTYPGAAGGAFLLWAYPAVLAGFAAPPRWAVPSEVGVGGIAVAGLAAAAVARGQPGSSAYLCVEAAAVISLAGAASVAVSQLHRANAALRAAEARIRQLAVETERARLARDLHDLLGHSLSLIQVKLQVLGQVLDRPERAARELAEVGDLTRRALQETRQAVSGYRQPTLAAEIAGAQIACAAAGIELDVTDVTGPIPTPVESTLAWSLREAVTNVVRHSAATGCRIYLRQDGGSARLDVHDNGCGAPSAHTESGLRTLRERVAAAGGTITAENRPGAGFALGVTLPLNHYGECR